MADINAAASAIATEKDASLTLAQNAKSLDEVMKAGAAAELASAKVTLFSKYTASLKDAAR
jgi:hypothetical protein